VFDLRHGFSSKGRGFPLAFNLWNSLFKERNQESDVNYFVTLEIVIRGKDLRRLKCDFGQVF